jgi:hypothetical protein
MLTRPKDTAPRQIDRMPPLPQQRLRTALVTSRWSRSAG